MIKAVVLCHPASKDLLTKSVFRSKRVDCIRIACGTSKVKVADYSESNDFFPTYASWNSALFETSVILTIWEHADQLIGDNHVMIIHSDIKPNHKPFRIWDKVGKWLKEEPDRSVGLTVPSSYIGMFDGWTIPDEFPITVWHDPMYLHAFDNNIYVWEFIKEYDYDIYEWAMDVTPRMIYSHQFACTRETFDYLGNKLYNVASRLRLRDIGFWTPHMFERLIGLYLAKRFEEPIVSTAFWHYASSGTFGPGEQSLYGPRALRFYRTHTRANLTSSYDNN